MKRATLSPRARVDLLGAIRWIARDNPPAARALRDEVALAAGRIAEHPEIGSLRAELADAPRRFLSLTGFPYIIIHNAARSPPLTLRILHGARDLPEVLRN